MTKQTLSRREFLGTSAGVAAASAVARRSRASGNPNALDLHGGTPVRTKPFPAWSQNGTSDEEYILKSLRKHR